MKLFISGGCGFLGSNLAHNALRKGDEVLVFDNLSRQGASSNLQWLQSVGRFEFHEGDIRRPSAIGDAIERFKPDAVLHLAGQVAMTTSIANPTLDFETNTCGTFYLLEAVRQFVPQATVVYSSTNKVYGDLERYAYEETPTRYICKEKPEGFDEETPLDFRSPYGCSKGAADQYMLDYARVFGLNTIVLRHSSMYGGRQFPTYDQGWIGWFCQKAVEAKNGRTQEWTISGTGKQVRDVLHVHDMVTLYDACLRNVAAARGQAFNIGGGMANSLSLLELFSMLEQLLGTNLRYTRLPTRESDQKVFVADVRKAMHTLGWRPTISPTEGVQLMIQWVSDIAQR